MHRWLLCGLLAVAACAPSTLQTGATTPAAAAISTPAPGSAEAAEPAPSTQPAAVPATGNTSAALADCPRAASLDRAAVAAEVSCRLQQYVQLSTVNPPGNEIVAARFLTEVLKRDGIDARVIESAPGRANLYARLPASAPATPGAGAIMLVHHMDTVPFSAEEWSVPPLAAGMSDGYLWGRGSFDDKAGGAISLLSMLLVKRLAIPLSRDLIVLAVADEEAGGNFGARYLVQHDKALFDGVEMVLNEGGGILQLDQGKVAYSVELSQKAPLWLRITAHGPSGHGSTPKPDSAVNVLLRALARLNAHRFETVVLPEVAAMYAERAAAMPEPKKTHFADLTRWLRNAAFNKEFMSDPGQAAMVHNTLSITMLGASDKENVIAPAAWAVADARLLPGQDAQKVTAELVAVMNEPAIKVEPILSWNAFASPANTPLFAAIRALAAKRDPGAPVTSNVIGGFTDCNAFRSVGLLCYGFLPMHVSMEEITRIHGKDERVSLDSLTDGVIDMVSLLQLAAPVH
jgi:acetylornithine deacetylase/succinyl-diaminopimelate desuccinylase-like protein